MTTENLDKKDSNIPHQDMWASITTLLFIIIAIIWILIFTHKLPTNYDVFFFILTIISGLYWLQEKISWKKYLPRNKKGHIERIWWLNWTAGLFPIIALMFLLRGFVGELISVPTGSMMPTIMIGDVNLTEKFYYDIKIPIIEKSLIRMHEVKRGEIVVFHYPPSPSTYFVKRFVGLPGDVLEYDYKNKVLKINDKEISRTYDQTLEDKDGGRIVNQYQEDLMGVKHPVWIDPKNFSIPNKDSFPAMKTCQYSVEKIVCKIPSDNYFALGDNRDNSLDSRYWGFVPRENIIGRAVYLLYSPTSMDRVGSLK